MLKEGVVLIDREKLENLEERIVQLREINGTIKENKTCASIKCYSFTQFKSDTETYCFRGEYITSDEELIKSLEVIKNKIEEQDNELGRIKSHWAYQLFIGRKKK